MKARRTVYLKNRVVFFIAAALALASTATATAPGPNGKILIQVGDSFAGSIAWVDPADKTIPPTPINPAIPCSSLARFADPAGTADGRIAVVRHDGCPGGTSTELLVLDGAGNLIRGLGNGLNGVQVAHPAWSPDGSLIAFEDDKPNGTSSISVIGSDGTGLHTVLAAGPSDSDTQPDWSPDGRQIAFQRMDLLTGQTSVAICNANGTGPIVDLTTGWGPTWSPDGTQIAFLDSGNLFKINVNDTGRTQLGSGGDSFTRASWSPDGSKIAWGPIGQGGIWLVDPTGLTSAVRLTTSDVHYNPNWTAYGPPVLPQLTINDVSLPEGNSGTTPFTFMVTLSAPSSHAVMVDYQTVGGTALICEDYQATSGTLTFLPGGPLSQNVTAQVFGDTLNEADETFLVLLQHATNATISRGQGVGTILNDDPPPSLSIDAQTLKTQGGDAYIAVRLSAESGQTVTVNYATADGTAKVADPDYVAQTGTLTFNPRVCRIAGDTLQAIFIPTIGDPVNAPPETFFVNLANPVNATIARGQGVITIYNIHGNTSHVGPNVSVNPVDSVTGTTPVTLSGWVLEPGDTTLITSSSCSPAPATFQLGNPPVCYDLKTTALFRSGTMGVCIHYTGINFAHQPQLFHFEGGAWKDVTTSVDTVNQIVCGVVTSLSPFALFEANQPPVAKCHNVTKSAGQSCSATVTAAEVNDGSFDPDGDPMMFTLIPGGPFSLGTTPVVLAVTDNLGASSQCNATITVVDTTPPAITCPPSLTVEFTDIRGAAVAFPPPAATDNCGVASLASTPPSGSTFPIGMTTVTSTATDLSGNHASCAFTVAVLGALGVKQNVLAELIALRASVGNGDDRENLDEAIGKLRASLNSAYWIDQTHLQARNGENVFENEKDAVGTMQELIKEKRSSISSAALQSAINRIAKADRLLAEIAINDAIAAHARPEKIAEAQREMARGDSEASAGKFEQAIERYGQAWKKLNGTENGDDAP